jgi:DNA helicase-2/ATP-dependent DNA helicase PcrA
LIPHSSATTQAQRSEEARLLHVAVTRAGDELVLTAAASRGGRATNPSPWLDDLAKTIVNRPFTGPPVSQRVIRPPDPLEPLRSWRADLARAAGVPDTAMCANSVLRSLLDDPPVDVDAVAKRLGVSTSAAERLAPRLLALLGGTTAS